jgi:hypothetical protein
MENPLPSTSALGDCASSSLATAAEERRPRRWGPLRVRSTPGRERQEPREAPLPMARVLYLPGRVPGPSCPGLVHRCASRFKYASDPESLHRVMPRTFRKVTIPRGTAPRLMAGFISASYLQTGPAARFQAALMAGGPRLTRPRRDAAHHRGWTPPRGLPGRPGPGRTRAHRHVTGMIAALDARDRMVRRRSALPRRSDRDWGPGRIRGGCAPGRTDC